MKKTLVLLFVLLFFSGCTEKTYLRQSRPFLGTIVEISVADKGRPRSLINNAINSAFAEIARIERLFSKFSPDSDISRINSAAYKQPVKVSAETIKLLQESINFSRLTGGAFDITLSPRGYKSIDILETQQSVSLSGQGINLDLGGIAKGYAVDRAIGVLRKEGVNSALINAGGDIYALGRSQRMQKWQIGLRHPRKKNAVLAVLQLEDKAVATSGDYERYTEIDGSRYNHITDPRTGRPCVDGPASVTVLAEDCLSADALATAIFVLGPKKGIDLINRLNNTEAIIASAREDKLDILVSSGLKGNLKFE